jgi:uncharacterized protein YndB with AHSA1/START domain
MPDILHRVEMKASPKDAFRALTTLEGLAGWWTTNTRGVADDADGIVEFRFGDRGGFDMKVLELEPGKRVAWRVVDGPDEWIGTNVSFDLTRSGDFTAVLFKHEGWKRPVEFMHHCSTKWAMFLMSLKSLAETGKGEPHPHDVHITGRDD